MTASAGVPELVDVTEVVLPGSAARLRSSAGVLGPADIPAWMSRGGGAALAAAAASEATAQAVRHGAAGLHRVLLDTAAALRWDGSAATAAEHEARAVHDRLLAVARELAHAGGALTGLAAALQRQHGVLGAAAGTWAHTADQHQRTVLLGRWQTAMHALDEADARAAAELAAAAAALARLAMADPLGGASAAAAPAAADGRPARPLGGPIGRVAGQVWSGAAEGLTAFGEAAGQNPDAIAELLAGAYLLHAGAGGEIAGTALDLTGAGAALGVPVNVVSGGLLVTGAGLMTMGAAQLGGQAGGSRSGAGGGGGRGAQPVNLSDARFAQRSAGQRFSTEGTFRGRLVDDVAEDLRRGLLAPEDVPIDVVRRDGTVLILNTRSSIALERAGVPRSAWKAVDRTGDPAFERRLDGQLARNRLDSNGVGSVRVGGEGR